MDLGEEIEFGVIEELPAIPELAPATLPPEHHDPPAEPVHEPEPQVPDFVPEEWPDPVPEPEQEPQPAEPQPTEPQPAEPVPAGARFATGH